MSDEYLSIDAERKLIYNPSTGKAREIRLMPLKQEVEDLSAEIQRLRAVLENPKALLAWAREEYSDASGLNRMLERRNEIMAIIKAYEPSTATE